ncbi:bifunctional RNase H/acid phosphatase [Streptomyces spiramenti]|uniref:bifunctional RNase H/acid phosphatase n=1 Tax=Streptomyces spiramenti TaxID=2720606 RepID=UPI003B83306E
MSGGGGRRLVVEADGGSRGNPGPAGYGAVVMDAASGDVLAETAEFIGRATNNVAEYRGLIAGLLAARTVDPAASVRVRMDSKLVVEQMSGRWKIKHPDMRPLAAEAGGVFPGGTVSYEWIPRSRNGHADRLANEAMDAGGRGESWRPSEPPGAAAEPEPEPEAAPVVPAVGWGGDPGTATTFVLLRHGETELTPQKRFSGSGADPGLSAAGRRQAAAAAAHLADRGTVRAVVTSPAARCRETAEAVANALGVDARVEADFREADFGDWEGLTFDEVRERHPEDLAAWLRSPEARPTGGCESFTAVARRVAVARDRAMARFAGRTVLVVSHVTPIKSLVRLALGAPPEAVFRMELSAASLSAVAAAPWSSATDRTHREHRNHLVRHSLSEGEVRLG